MSQRLKRWESPRHEGRNAKGRGGSARQRQLFKRQQQLRKRLKANAKDAKLPDDGNPNTFGHSPGNTHRPNTHKNNHKKGRQQCLPFFMINFAVAHWG